jgi:hypothetical protein
VRPRAGEAASSAGCAEAFGALSLEKTLLLAFSFPKNAMSEDLSSVILEWSTVPCGFAFGPTDAPAKAPNSEVASSSVSALERSAAKCKGQHTYRDLSGALAPGPVGSLRYG